MSYFQNYVYSLLDVSRTLIYLSSNIYMYII